MEILIFGHKRKMTIGSRMVIALFGLYPHVVIRTGGCLITDELLPAFSYCRFVLKHGRMNLLRRTMGFPGKDEL